MGSCVSRLDRQEMVSRSKARYKYIQLILKARHSLALSHALYLRSLRATGASLLRFSTFESSLYHHQLNHRITPPPQPPSMSPTSATWTTASTTSATVVPPPPPPWTPPSTVAREEEGGIGWDYWGGTEDEWEETRVRVAASVAGVTETVSGYSKESSEMAVVVSNSRQGKEFVEIIKELDEYFLRAVDSAADVSVLLELPSSSSSSGKVYSNNGGSLSWNSRLWGGSGKFSGKLRLGEDYGMLNVNNNVINTANNNNGASHYATLERLYAWEKKLFHEVKNAEKLRMEHEKRVEQLRRLQVKRGDYMKTQNTKKEVDKLESLLEVASQSIQSTSDEIIQLRETELFPQLLNLIQGFMCMWRSMYECHQVQMHIVDQLKYLNAIPSIQPTSEIHRQTTLQLEVELQHWHQSFTNLVKSQRDYLHSLTGWLRLSLFQFVKNPLMRSIQDSTIYSLCEKWQLEIDHVPDKVASEGIKTLLNVVHAIVVQQGEEYKQKKRSESANKDLEKRAIELRSLEGKYGPYSFPEVSGSRTRKDPVGYKRAKVEFLKNKAEEENAKYEKAVGVTRAMTLNNMQMGLPHVFQAITGFSSVCTEGFEKVYNHAKNSDQELDVKRLMG